MEEDLQEWGKNYFKSLINNTSNNLVLGDTLNIGVEFIKENGEKETIFVTTINKKEL